MLLVVARAPWLNVSNQAMAEPKITSSDAMIHAEATRLVARPTSVQGTSGAKESLRVVWASIVAANWKSVTVDARHRIDQDRVSIEFKPSLELKGDRYEFREVRACDSRGISS